MNVTSLSEHVDGLLARVAETADRAEFFDACLDSVVEQLGADRGLLFLFHDGGGAEVLQGRRQGRTLDPYEREEVSRSVVREARQSGEITIVSPLDASGAESLHGLGIATAICAPIPRVRWDTSSGDGPPAPEGVLYVDFRARDRVIGDTERAFLVAASRLLGLAFAASQAVLRARESAREARVAVSAGRTLTELLSAASLAGVRREIASALGGDTPILILGETGTGKTELAAAIADASGRRPVVRCTLGASDDLNTITSELFGHERGAFSGAIARRAGLVELADGGTLVFDEILNLPPTAQQLLLDFTQFGTYRPLGYAGREPKQSRVRLIAATNGDLDAAMRDGKFRTDLYYRLAGCTVSLPPLRERRGDVASIAEGVLVRLDPARPLSLSVPLRRLLASDALPWPGNVRQLELAVRRARERARADGATTLTVSHFEPRDLGVARVDVPRPRTDAGTAAIVASFEIEPDELGDSWARLSREREALDEIERRLIETALVRAAGNVAEVARELGVGRTSLLSRMETLGVARGARGKRA